MGRTRSISWAALLLGACRADADPWAQLPETDQLGERVAIGTDVVERVCAGTLANVDAEIARIEHELELDASEDRYRLWILPPEQVSSLCPLESSCADVDHGAIVSADNFIVERRTARELTQVLLHRNGFEAHPFFTEGLAGAMSWPSCPPDYVLVRDRYAWIDYVGQWPEAQVVAGELIRWVLHEYGLEHLLEYIGVLPRANAKNIDTFYTAYFGSTIVHDLDEHMFRGAAGAHCFAPEPEPEPTGTRFLRLQASLECDSPRVQSDFETPGFGFVEWTLPVSKVGFYELRGELPEGSLLEITRCMCDGFWTPFEPFDPAGGLLYDGPFQLRWRGPLDAGLELDIELVQPCSVTEQDCDAGEKCLHPESGCQPLVDEPIVIGEPCTVADGEPDPCVAGAWCFGTPDADGLKAGVCMRQCDDPDADFCPAGEHCESFLAYSFCVSVCDNPIGNDCAANMACLPSFGGDELLCLPAGQGTLYEPCDGSCAPGFLCHDGDDVPCEESCCVPICEKALAGAGCPPELPVCTGGFGPNEAFGYCGSTG
jgi:hypothetical protein